MHLTKIAVVEDNADNRLLLEALLSERYDLQQYQDGTTALAGMRCDPPDLVLLDISLPDRSGRDVLLALRADPALADIPVVAITAYAMVEDRQIFLQQGFDAYVSKPIVDVEVLLGTIERLVSKPGTTDAGSGGRPVAANVAAGRVCAESGRK